MLLLPHRDPTLTSQQGNGIVDLQAAFSARVTAPVHLDERLAALPRSSPTGAQLLLRGEAAAALLRRERRTQREWLAALSVAYELSSSSSSVRLRLDDLELTRGSTERSRDAVSAGSSLPYQPELEALTAEHHEVLLERDQQLPALGFLLGRSAASSAKVGGSFALQHRSALARNPHFERAEWTGGEGPPLFLRDGSDWLAHRRDYAPAVPEGPWAGFATLAEVLSADAGTLAGARAISLGLCGVREGAVLGADGTSAPITAVGSAIAALQRTGCVVWAEWWVGAPGVTAAEHEALLPVLMARQLGHPSGVRTFHFSVARQATADFAGKPLSLLPPDETRDLARSRGFLCAGTLLDTEREALAHRVLQALSSRHPLWPGRVAGALVLPTGQPPAVDGERFKPAESVAFVALPVSLEGLEKPSLFAVSLAGGNVLSLDVRLAPALCAWSAPARAADALPQLPETARTRLVQALCTKGFLTSTRDSA